MTAGDVVLLVFAALVLLVVVYEGGKTAGYRDGWNAARGVWRAAWLRESESADFWRKAATATAPVEHTGKE